MKKQELDTRITETAKALLSYCRVRTASSFEAEDLAQDIIVEIYKSVDNLRNEEAFYRFMWAVAGNVYKQWCKNKAKNKICPLSEDLLAEESIEEEKGDIFLLRRELTLLAKKYRRAVILYYIENKSCSEIAQILSISESMVKYLLFKSRQLLKEGMVMERNYGEQSYNPKSLSLLFWGKGENPYGRLCESKISQNILFACYNDKLTPTQISLEIGVALPYMEDKLKELYDYGLLKKDGNRYYTNLFIFTKDFSREVWMKTAHVKDRIATLLVETIKNRESQIRAIGFVGNHMNNNGFAWQIVSFLLYEAVVEILQNKRKIVYPKDQFGRECFLWGEEKDQDCSWISQLDFGISGVTNNRGDYIQFMDFPINGEMVHPYFFHRENVTHVFLDIAKGNTEQFSENDMAAAADMVRKGYVLQGKNGLTVNVPVFTQEQYHMLKEILSDRAVEIAKEGELLIDTVQEILKNHCPLHLKKYTKDMAYLRVLKDAISTPVARLLEQKYLLPYRGDTILPTTYVVLK